MSQFGGNLDYISALPINDGIDLIITATNEKAEHYAHTRWSAAWQHEMSYEEYKNRTGFNRVSLSQTTNQNEAEILNEVKDILNNMERNI